MDKDEFKRLFKRYQHKQCTSAELKSLLSFVESDEAINVLEDVWEEIQREESELHPLVSSDSKLVYQNILKDSRFSTTEPKSLYTPKWYHNNRVWLQVAATVVIVSGMFWLVAKQQWPASKNPITVNRAIEVVVPGREQARIIFDDGSSLDLNKIEGDTVIKREGITIVKEKDGLVRYRASAAANYDGKPRYNTIITPKGGEYRVELPDGSHVWLNAQTSLRYPVNFHGKVRQVELDGEAYFQVTRYLHKGHHLPFVIHTGNQRLEVMGTVFNINSFNNITTTLIEGKVKLQALKGNGQQTFLLPNEQSVYREDSGKFTITEVDPLYATSWRNGNFSFDKATIHEVMGSIGRWYDVDVEYKGRFVNNYFSGTISKFEDIDKLLETIALTGGVHFKREGRRIIVMK